VLGHPICWNPTPVRLKLVRDAEVAPTSIRRDRDFGEMQYGQSKPYESFIDLEAQIAYKNKDEQEVTLTGDAANADGHLTFLTRILNASGIVLSKGDLVIRIENNPVDYKLIEVRPAAHLGGVSGILMAFFAANDETRPSLRR